MILEGLLLIYGHYKQHVYYPISQDSILHLLKMSNLFITCREGADMM